MGTSAGVQIASEQPILSITFQAKVSLAARARMVVQTEKLSVAGDALVIRIRSKWPLALGIANTGFF